jgi:hypothetical protein
MAEMQIIAFLRSFAAPQLHHLRHGATKRVKNKKARIKIQASFIKYDED